MGQLISVIIPVYKVEDFLDEAVNSVINQSYRQLEIILVDDGSPDNCGMMCDHYAKLDRRIKVVHKENGGLSDARNAGLAVANGDYIGFVDSDDFIDSKMYEDLLEKLENNPNAYMSACPIIRNKDGAYSAFQIGKFSYCDGLSLSMEDYLKLFLNFKIDSSAWNKLYKREFIKHFFIKGRVNEDYPFLYYNCKEWFDTDAKVVMCGTPHYYYRTRVNSICHQDKKYLDPLLVAVSKNCIEIIDDLKTWNKSLIPIVYKRLEFATLKAMGQIILTPMSIEKYPEECGFINTVIRHKLSLFRKGMSSMNRVKLIIFRYFPFLWKVKRNQK